MKKLYLYLTAIVLFAGSCNTTEDEVVKVNFINETGSRLDQIVIERENPIPLGDLNNEEQTGYISLDEIHFDTGYPDEPLTGYINGEKYINYSKFYFCGTEKHIKTDGTYQISIQQVTILDTSYLVLELIR